MLNFQVVKMVIWCYNFLDNWGKINLRGTPMSPILMLEYPARAWQSVLYSAMEMVPSPDRSNLANTSDRAAPGDCRSDECEV